jgi:Zn-dependent M28 family amino/carboxypeptidase
VDIGERNIPRFYRQLAQAADYIETKFTDAGLKVNRQKYEACAYNCCNLEVEIRGAVRPAEIVVVGAHYDTAFDTPGADDNTSGIAATLALARRFANSKLNRTLRFVAFVNEEPSFFQTENMGSLVYARRCRKKGDNIVAMFSLEMLGYYSDAPGSQHYPAPFSYFYPSEGIFIGFISNTASRKLVREAIAAFRQNEQFPSEGAAVPGFIPGVGFSDHWSFWQAGYPAIMITDTAMIRNPHYHELTDTIDKIDFDRMARVVRGLDKVIAGFVGRD